MPTPNPSKVAMFCTIPSRQSPASIIKQILRSLQKEFSFETSESQHSFDSSRSQSTCVAKDSDQNEIILRADNWADCELHLFIRISSPTPKKVEEILITEVKKHFRGASTQESIDKNVTILPYAATTSSVGDLELSITTGDFEDCHNPSTLITAAQNGEVIARCLLTWCHNLETFINGPTIQYICVKKDHRRRGIGSKLLQWLTETFLSEVYMPKAKKISLYATNICSAHEFFIKNGFSLFDFYNEEGRKDYTRPPKTSQSTDTNSKDSEEQENEEIEEQAETQDDLMDTNE